MSRWTGLARLGRSHCPKSGRDRIHFHSHISLMWRPSASMILLARWRSSGDSMFNYKILCQKRSSNISQPGMYTFPGGVFEDGDGCLQQTALRELFEETGILHCNPLFDSTDRINILEQLRQDPSAFNTIWKARGPSVLPHMIHYCTFVTPTFEKRRYSTMFFLSEICNGESITLSDSPESELNSWLNPSEALLMHTKGQIRMLPPQFYILHYLSKQPCIDGLFDNLRASEKKVLYAEGSSPDGTIDRYHPEKCLSLIDSRGFKALRPHPMAPNTIVHNGQIILAQKELRTSAPDDLVTLTLPGDELHDVHPGPEGQTHRIHCVKPIGTGMYSFETTLD